MKQYKLIKEYPGSPLINSIYKEILGQCGRGSGKMYKNLDKDGCCIDSRDIEKHPIYWQELCERCNQPLKKGEDISYKNDCKCVEKDYEILSFKSDNAGTMIIYKKRNDNLFYTKYSLGFKESDFFLLQAKINGFHIHSVKRLSDGEIFTIGDRTISVGIIKSFDITPCNDLCVNGKKICDDIEFIQLVKKPLFTTEDGVDIFEGDGYWKVTNSFNKSSVHSAKKTFRGNASNCTSKYFKILKNAEEYILMNKPCLSINNVMNQIKFEYNQSLYSNLKRIKNNLITLINNKI